MGITRPHFLFFCYAVSGTGISGGDRIFIEFAKRWSKNNSIVIYTSEEGRQLLIKQQLDSDLVKVIVIDNKKYLNSFLLNYIYKIYSGTKTGLTLKINQSEKVFVYSASEFWMDSFPAILLKIRYRQVTWLAAWYQTAPNPLKGFAEIGRKSVYRLSALYLWLNQLPIKSLVRGLADYVLVNNINEKNTFPNLAEKSKAIVVLGAVNVEDIQRWQKTHKYSSKFAAVFQGRFHPQKGVVEMIEIWRLVVDKIPTAKLAMIGDGPLWPAVQRKIKELNLAKNVELFGYLFDGDKKYQIFSQSQIVVHPAFFDSGGMAAAEAMAFGIPVVAFDLKSYESYYPQGMLKVQSGNLADFAKSIIGLLENSSFRSKLGDQALQMIKDTWSWDKRAAQVYEQISVGKILQNK